MPGKDFSKMPRFPLVTHGKHGEIEGMTGLVEVEQEFIKPNAYSVGGKVQDFSASVLASYVSDTNKALAAGFEIPVLNKHTKLGATDEEHAEAATGTDGKGWLRSVRQTPSGSLIHRLAVTPDVKQGMEAGTIRFTSPYFWPGYTTSDGKALGNIIRHVAITPKPRTQDQGPFQFAEGQQLGWQFSLEDAVPDESDSKIVAAALLKDLSCYGTSDELDLDDSEISALIKALKIVSAQRKAAEEKSREAAKETGSAMPFDDAADSGDDAAKKKPFPPKSEDRGGDAKPADDAEGDAPADDAGGGGDPAYTNLLSQVVTELGVVLPDGIDPTSEQGMVVILTAVINTVKGGKQGGPTGQPGAPPIKEATSMPTAQFSDDPEKQALANRIEKLEADRRQGIAARGRATLKAALKGLPKGIANRLDSIAGSVQFSDEGKEEPRLTISEVADLVRTTLPAAMFAEPKEEPHPSGDQFTESPKGELSPERVKELAAFAGGGAPPKA
jgi:hypothetical protein